MGSPSPGCLSVIGDGDDDDRIIVVRCLPLRRAVAFPATFVVRRPEGDTGVGDVGRVKSGEVEGISMTVGCLVLAVSFFLEVRAFPGHPPLTDFRLSAEVVMSSFPAVLVFTR